jgi:hypothetical protein
MNMKLLISLMVLLSSLFVNAQQSSLPRSMWPPVYLLDSVKYAEMPCFDLQKITNIYVAHEYDTIFHAYGKIYITTKNPGELHFIPLTQVAKQCKLPLHIPVIFMLDNEFIKKTSTFFIDSAYILKTEIVKGAELESVNKDLSNLTIVRIVTRTKENIDKQKQIWIRGAGLPENLIKHLDKNNE